MKSVISICLFVLSSVDASDTFILFNQFMNHDRYSFFGLICMKNILLNEEYEAATLKL